MNRAPHPASLDLFKRKAKAVKRAAGCTHAEAQETVARVYGFAHYHEAHRFYARLAASNQEECPDGRPQAS